MAPARWQRFSRGFYTHRPDPPDRPGRHSQRLGNYQLTEVGSARVLCVKSELHLNQDGVKTGEGIVTLPVRDLFTQIITETGAGVVVTIGTAGSVFDEFQLGDVVVTRAAKFRCRTSSANETFNHATYRSGWTLRPACWTRRGS